MSASTMVDAEPELGRARRYQFGPSEPRGVILGQSWGQLGLIVVDMLLVLLLLQQGVTVAFRVVVAVLLGMAVLFSYVPVKNLTPIGWAGYWLANRVQSGVGHDQYHGGMARMRRSEIQIPSARLPGLLGDFRFLEFNAGPATAPMAVAHNTRDNTYVAVVQVEGATFHLLEAAEQDNLQDAYSQMLTALCRANGTLARLQIFERTVPDTADALNREFRVRGRAHGDVADAGDPSGTSSGASTGAGSGDSAGESGMLFAGQSYQQLIDAAGPAGQRHEMFLAIALSGPKAAKAISKAGGGDRDRGAATVLAREVQIVCNNLIAAGVRVQGWAPPRLLAYILRTAFDPASTGVIDRRGGGINDIGGGDGGLPSGVDLRQAAPHRTQNRWDAYRSDSAFHRAYWIAEWPRKGADAAFLSPLLMFAGGRRTISLVYEPRSEHAARKTLEKKLEKMEADSGLRARFKMRFSKRAGRNMAHLNRREEELLDGEMLLALRAYVTISANTMDELESLEADIMARAAQSSVELQPMYGAHDQGFAVGAVPLARFI